MNPTNPLPGSAFWAGRNFNAWVPVSQTTTPSHFAISPTAFAASVDGEVMVMDVEQGNYVALDPVASRIWSLLSEAPDGMAAADIVARLASKYEATDDVIATDVAVFLADLKSRGLVETR